MAKKAIQLFGQTELIHKLMPMASFAKQIHHPVPFIHCVNYRHCQPQIGSKMEEVKREGVDLIMIAIDLSNSMLAEDLQPDSLDASQTVHIQPH